MAPIHLRAKVGPDGVLHLDVPVGADEADHEVEVTVRPARPTLTQEEWHQFIAETTGAWKGISNDPSRASSRRENCSSVIYPPDTNGWAAYLRGKHAGLLRRFAAERSSDILLCSVVVAELAYGAHHSPTAYRAHNIALLGRLRGEFASVPFDDAAAEEYGRLRAHLAASGQMIGPNDLLIASISLARGLILVTHNVREFSREPGLVVEDRQGP